MATTEFSAGPMNDTDEARLSTPLESLTFAGIVLRESTPEAEYSFKHASLQETAYHMLLRKRRQALHGAVARAVIRLYPGDEHVDIIAHHFAQTDEHASAVVRNLFPTP